MLAEQKKRGWRKKLLKRPPKRKKNQGNGDVRKVVLSRVLGKDWAKTEAAFARMVKASETKWLARFQVTGRIGDRIVLAGTNKDPAEIKFTGELPAGDFTVSARVTLEEVSSRKAIRVLFTGSDSRIRGIIFHAGSIYISDWRNDKWHDVAKCKAAIETGKPFEFSIEMGSSIRVKVDGKQAIEHQADTTKYRTGLYFAINDSLGWLENIRIEAVAPANK